MNILVGIIAFAIIGSLIYKTARKDADYLAKQKDLLTEKEIEDILNER